MTIKELDGSEDQTETLFEADEALSDGEEEDELQPKGKPSRSERKCRKAFANLGTKRLHGVSKVTLRKLHKGSLAPLVIEEPEVYEWSDKDGRRYYVVFGRAKWDDGDGEKLEERERRLSEAAERFKAPGAETGGGLEMVLRAAEQELEGEDVSESELGVEEVKDTNLIMSHTGLSRARALAALKASDGDVVAAIMSLS